MLKIWRHSLLLTFFFFLLYIPNLIAQSQTWQIKGQVTGEASQPMVAATVALVDTDNKEVQKTITDSSGRFLITFSKNGTLCFAGNQYQLYCIQV
jgi:competence protein ComGC